MEQQKTQLNKEHISLLAATGYPLSVEVQLENPSLDDLAEAVLMVMTQPSARLVEAAANVLVYLSRQPAFELPDFSRLDLDSRRRLGFLVESLSRRLPDSTLLSSWTEALKALVKDSPLSPPLVMTRTATKRRMLRLQNEAGELNDQWNVLTSHSWLEQMRIND